MNVYFFAHIRVGTCLYVSVCQRASGCMIFVLLWRGMHACPRNPEALILRVCVCGVCVCVYALTRTSCPGREAAPVNPAFRLREQAKQTNIAIALRPGSSHLNFLSGTPATAPYNYMDTPQKIPWDGLHPSHEGLPPSTRPVTTPHSCPWALR